MQLSEIRAQSSSAEWLDEYLRVLGLRAEPPSLAYLRRLTRAHLLRIPFENITSILRRAAVSEGPVPALDRDAELRSWAAQRGGGVCFEVVEMFGNLLAGLGFQTHGVLATISFVGSHQANLVELDGQRYLVDAGNGAPFFEPIPLSPEGTPVEIHHVGLAYRFRPAPDRPNAWIQDRLIESHWQPFCTYDLSPASADGRVEAFQRHHLRGQSWVVDNLTIVRCTETDVWSLRDDRLTHFDAQGKSTFSVNAPGDYQRLVAETFGLPAAPVDAALAVLRR